MLVILCVGAFILDSENRLLIVKKSLKELVDGGLWTVPGGKIEPSEGIINGLKREICEEVGLEITDYDWLGEDVFESGGYFFHGEHFLCHIKSTKNIVLEKKLEEYRWIRKDEIQNFKFHPNIKKRIENTFKNIYKTA